MLEIYEKIVQQTNPKVDEIISLDHLLREKGRFKIRAESGCEVRVFLERGQLLSEGQYLLSRCGKIVQVSYAEEPIVRATAADNDWKNFVRVCYHLGNRHVRLQIGDCWLQMTHDHVLEEMIKSFGLSVEHCNAVFIPEAGAYTQGHSHRHETEHQHEH